MPPDVPTEDPNERAPGEVRSATAREGISQPRRRMHLTQWLLVPFASLENRDFRYLWLGQLGQASAMWAELVARNWLTWQLTGSATAIGLVNLFRALPLITLGLFGGVVADRFDKRKVLIIIQVWSLAIYVVMAVLVLGDLIKLWHLYLTAFLLGGGMAMNQPIRTAFIPQLLGGRRLVNAISLNSIAINVTRWIGPAAIGFLIAFSGDNVGPADVVSAAVYVLVLASTFMIRARGTRRDGPETSFKADFIEGFRYMLVENRTVLDLVVIAMVPLAFGFSYITLLPVFVTGRLDMDASGLGVIQSIGAVGALVGGFTLASMKNVPHKGRIMLISGVGYGIGVMALGGSSMTIVALGVVIVIGASQTVFRTANNTALLEITPPRFQGRVVSITFLDMGVQALAGILAGVVTDLTSVSVGLAALGAVCIGIVALIWVGVPSVRRL